MFSWSSCCVSCCSVTSLTFRLLLFEFNLDLQTLASWLGLLHLLHFGPIAWNLALCTCVQGCPQIHHLSCCLVDWLWLPLIWLLLPLLLSRNLELQMASTGSDLPTIDTIKGPVVIFVWMANWLRAPSSMLMANFNAFSGSNATSNKSFCFSGLSYWP